MLILSEIVNAKKENSGGGGGGTQHTFLPLGIYKFFNTDLIFL